MVGITHTDTHQAPTVADYHLQLKGSGLNPAIFQVDARDKTDMATLVRALLFSIDPGLKELA